MPVVYVNIPKLKKEQELNIRLNKNLGQWDWDLLANFDEELLLKVGFEAGELDNIFDLEKGLTKPDDVPNLPEKPKARIGNIYQLGDLHRVMCGDSTDMGQMEKLMGKVKVNMIFTDPPYNVNYSGQGRNTSEGIRNDALPEKDFGIFIDKAFHAMAGVMKDGAVYYICSGWSSYPIFHYALLNNGFYRAGVIIWVKNNTSSGWNDYRYKHEWIVVGKRKSSKMKKRSVSIMYGWKKGRHFFLKTRDEYDIWEVPKKNTQDYLHPTEKPVWLIEKALANSSQRDWNILDPFGGSGSTLIACERLKRKCFTMELDPKYVDVIIQRWENYTGKKAEKLNGKAKN